EYPGYPLSRCRSARTIHLRPDFDYNSQLRVEYMHLVPTSCRDLRSREARVMKPDIHPTYQKAVVHCACGNSFETRSTVSDIHVEICSTCHPFFTGKQKLV